VSLASARAKVGTAHRQLLVDWERAKESWDDPASQAFGRHHVDPLEHAVRSAIGAIEHMAEVLERARRECGDPDAGR
jgi:hypothetical protein